MRLSEIKLVVQSIVEKMTCPFCQKKIQESQVNVAQIVNNKCALQVRCAHCQKETTINADIQKRKIPFPIHKKTSTQKKAFDLEKLSKFSKNLQKLKGDLKDLL